MKYENQPEAGLPGGIVASCHAKGSETPVKWAFRSGVRLGRGWRWAVAGDDHELLDLAGKIVARIVPDGTSGYLVTHPACTPRQSAETLDAARKLAVSVALAALPLDRETAARTARHNDPARILRETAWGRPLLPSPIFMRHTPPLNIIGGYRFPGAPEVDLSAAIAPQIAAGQPVVDPWEIPDFLRRSLWPAVETVVEMKAAA
jgi:hypothetical protein